VLQTKGQTRKWFPALAAVDTGKKKIDHACSTIYIVYILNTSNSLI
jgi:hypothetical protein